MVHEFVFSSTTRTVAGEIMRFLLFGGLLRFLCTWSSLPTLSRVTVKKVAGTTLTFLVGHGCHHDFEANSNERGWIHVV